MKVGSLFSGIGGFDLGLERAGMQIIWQSEIEPYCCKVLKKWWPEVPNLGDIFSIKNPPSVDLICGGFPCQPFSVAGKRKGKKDDRYIWPEMFRVIAEVKPRWVFAENVPGILHMELNQVLSDLEGEGYETGTLIIPACALNAPHRRDRVWIVAYAERAKQELAWRARMRGERLTNTDRHAPDTTSERKESISERKESIPQQGQGGSTESKNRHAPDTERKRFNKSRWPKPIRTSNNKPECSSWAEGWPEVATRLCRVDDGLPAWVHRHRVARLKALGNAIVPQIAEEIGKMILEIDTEVMKL